jgi:hypothetical protein
MVNDANINIKVAQEVLGHTNIETTVGYVHAENHHLMNAANALATLGQNGGGTGVVTGGAIPHGGVKTGLDRAA